VLKDITKSIADYSVGQSVGLQQEVAKKIWLYEKAIKMDTQLLNNRPHLIPVIIAALMLLLALASWPYGYYQLLRFVACGVAVYVAFMAYNWQKMWATWLFGFIAVLFNPLIPIHLSRET